MGAACCELATRPTQESKFNCKNDDSSKASRQSTKKLSKNNESPTLLEGVPSTNHFIGIGSHDPQTEAAESIATPFAAKRAEDPWGDLPRSDLAGNGIHKAKAEVEDVVTPSAENAAREEASGAAAEARKTQSPGPGGAPAKTVKRKGFKGLQRVESKEERDFAKQWDITSRLISNLDVPKSKRKSSKDMFRQRGRSMSVVEHIGTVAEEGPRIDFPVTFARAEGLRAHFNKHGADKPMNHLMVNQLLDAFTDKYKVRHKSAVSDVCVPSEGKSPRLIVVGDTHGQLQDVLYIFSTYGPPTKSNTYLFNGDVADRGPNSSEIFLLVFAYYLADEQSILMNRGNHESEEMNALDSHCGGGFRDEVLTKFGSDTFWKFAAMMKILQLATVVGKQVFVVHGGLSEVDPLRLDFIRSIDHTRLTMPPVGTTVKEEQVWNDLLWSDPQDSDGVQESSRGVGVVFGPDVTAKFCKDNKPIKFIVRGHQLPEEQKGYQKQVGDRCITIFSASNYCGNTGNKGGVLIFAPGDFPNYVIHEHYAPTLDMISKMVASGDGDWASAGEALREQEKKEIEEIGEKKMLQTMVVAIVESKPEIWAYIISEIDGATMISYNMWIRIMHAVIGPSWQWDVAWQAWELGDVDGTINMKDFLQRFTVIMSREEYTTFKFKAITAVYEAILHGHTSLASTLELFDRDGDGIVDVPEMREAINDMELNLTDAQKDSVIHTLFKDAREVDGVPRLQVEDFLSRFTVVYKRSKTSISQDGFDQEQCIAQEAMSKIARLIASIPIETLVSSAPKPPKKMGRQSSQGSLVGRRNTWPFSPGTDLTKVKSLRSKEVPTGTTLAVKVETLFAAFDVDGSGALDLDEFAMGIMCLPGITAIELSDGRKLDAKCVGSVAKAVDHSGDGEISILELLEALSFEDTGGDDIGDSLAEHMLTVLFRHRQSLRAGARCFDQQSTGRVTRDEFYRVLLALNRALSAKGGKSVILDSQASDLSDALSTRERGFEEIVYEDFFNSFTVVDRQNASTCIRLGRRKSR